MKPIIERFREIMRGKKFLTAAVIAGAVGMLLILLSGTNSTDKDISVSDAPSSARIRSEEYRRELEKRLEKMLSEIQGVGDVSVTITLGASEEYIYAAETKVSGDKVSTEYVIADKEGIITRVDPPEITGAVIVCEGGGNSRICEKVYEAVSVSLGLPASRICVVKMK